LVQKFATLGYVEGISFQHKMKLNLQEFLNWSANKK